MWSIWGDGIAVFEPSDTGPGTMLHVAAASYQTIDMNSFDFAVIPGANYTVAFGAKIAPSSVGSGYLSLVFLNQTEGMRRMIYLEPPLAILGTGATDSSGAFNLVLRGFPTGFLQIKVEYSGDDTFWPAYATFMLEN